jgi:hypothetical protein
MIVQGLRTPGMLLGVGGGQTKLTKYLTSFIGHLVCVFLSVSWQADCNFDQFCQRQAAARRGGRRPSLQARSLSSLFSRISTGQTPPQGTGKAGENGQPGGLLCKSCLQETVGYAGGKLPAGVANDWVTSGRS